MQQKLAHIRTRTPKARETGSQKRRDLRAYHTTMDTALRRSNGALMSKISLVLSDLRSLPGSLSEEEESLSER